jgi:predicted transcriptional regulator
MSAKDDILTYLRSRGHEGALQSELYNLRYSRSTISEALDFLEKEKLIVRREIGKKAYRIWLIDEAPFPVKDIVRLGILRAVEYPHALLTAQDLKEKYDVRVLVYNSALELTNALALGKVDLACSPLITQILYGLLMRSVKIVAGCGFGGSGLVVRKELKEGIKIGSSELSTMETMLKLFLERKGLIEKVNVIYFKNPESMMGSLLSGEIDALSIWEPYLTLLERRGFKIYRYKNYFGNYPCCSLGVNLGFLEINREIFDDFVRRYRENTERLGERKEEAIKIMQSLFGFERDLIEHSFEGYVYDYKLEKEKINEALARFGLKVFNLDKLILTQGL